MRTRSTPERGALFEQVTTLVSLLFAGALVLAVFRLFRGREEALQTGMFVVAGLCVAGFVVNTLVNRRRRATRLAPHLAAQRRLAELLTRGEPSPEVEALLSGSWGEPDEVAVAPELLEALAIAGPHRVGLFQRIAHYEPLRLRDRAAALAAGPVEPALAEEIFFLVFQQSDRRRWDITRSILGHASAADRPRLLLLLVDRWGSEIAVAEESPEVFRPHRDALAAIQPAHDHVRGYRDALLARL